MVVVVSVSRTCRRTVEVTPMKEGTVMNTADRLVCEMVKVMIVVRVTMSVVDMVRVGTLTKNVSVTVTV